MYGTFSFFWFLTTKKEHDEEECMYMRKSLFLPNKMLHFLKIQTGYTNDRRFLVISVVRLQGPRVYSALAAAA